MNMPYLLDVGDRLYYFSVLHFNRPCDMECDMSSLGNVISL